MNKKIKNIILLITISFLSAPLLSYAGDFKSAAVKIISYSEIIVKILIAVSFALFFWGILAMVASGDNSKAKEVAKTRIVWGLIILFMLFSVWSLLAFLRSTTNLTETKLKIDISNLPASLSP